MIEKISKINNFGPYKNFDWRCKENFGDFNLFFGWNYSGKTSLSRIFRSFEKGSLDDDYIDSKFSIKTDGITLSEENIKDLNNIRVFNRDFVKDNLKWDECKAESFIMIGEENIKLKEERDELVIEKGKKEESRQKNSDEKEKISDELEKAKTDKARIIKNELALPNFDKGTLRKEIDQIIKNYNDFKLTNEEFAFTKNVGAKQEKKEIIKKIEDPSEDLNNQYSIVSNLSLKIVTHEGMQKLDDDEKLRSWVEEGVLIHNESTTCKFCGNKFSTDMREKYHNYFSKEYSMLQKNLNEQKEVIRKLNISKITLVKDQFHSEFATEFMDIVTRLNDAIEEYNALLSSLDSMIDSKINDIFVEKKCPEFHYMESITGVINELNILIEKNNKTTEYFQNTKDNAYKKLISHYAAEFVIDTEYEKKNSEITNYKETIETDEKEIIEISNRIKKINEMISNADIAALEVNKVLSKYYMKEEIAIKASDEKFILHRNGDVAKNLSEGEQTSIAFAYFIARLNDPSVNKSDLIIFIDDPISSLDSNHIMMTYSMIKNEFSKYNEKKIVPTCHQLFVSTHNYEFFNHLKKALRDDGGKNTAKKYLIRRFNNGTSTIEDLPKTLKNYDSEYQYIFHRLSMFLESPSDDFDHIYEIPNIARKLLEAYFSFKFQSPFDRSNASKLFAEPHDADRVHKYVNHGSHLRADGLTQHIDNSECMSIVKIIMSSINKQDPMHYESLTEAYNSNKE